jgi:hypothetical protein
MFCGNDRVNVQFWTGRLDQVFLFVEIPILERTTRMARNRRAARAVAIQQETAAQAAAGWLFVFAGLAAVTALASGLSFVLG